MTTATDVKGWSEVLEHWEESVPCCSDNCPDEAAYWLDCHGCAEGGICKPCLQRSYEYGNDILSLGMIECRECLALFPSLESFMTVRPI